MKKRCKKAVLDDRRRKVAELTLRGLKQDEIARRLGVNQSTIGRDLDMVRGEWRQSAIRDFDEARGQELEKLALIETEAWAAWQRSQQPLQAASLANGKDGQRSSSSLKHQYGDPRFLDQINKCVTQRCILLGLQPAAVTREDIADAREPVEVRRERVFGLLAQLGQRERIGEPGAGHYHGQPGGPGAGDEPGQVASGAAPDVAGPGPAGSH